MPNSFFTQTIHSPERGSVWRRFENVASTRYGAPRPIESVKKLEKPNHGSPLAPPTASSATTGGPTHGAANTPPTRPEKNTPAALVVPLPPSFSSSHGGGWSS